MIQTLLTFDSTPFVKHITTTDDIQLIEFIIREYGPALQYGISVPSEQVELRILTHYQDAYLQTVLSTGNHFLDESNSNKTFKRRVIDDEGNVLAVKARYDELVEACVNHFNSQIIAVLRGIQSQAKQIYTVSVLGYANRTLKLLLKTDGEFNP